MKKLIIYMSPCSLSLPIWISCWLRIDLATAAYGRVLIPSLLYTVEGNIVSLLSYTNIILEICRLAILALHKALVDQPRYPSVVAAFSLAVHNGGDVQEAVKITRKITKPHDRSFFELLEPEKLDSQTLLNEVMDFDVAIKEALGRMTDSRFVSKAMSAYPQAPSSNMVITPTSPSSHRTMFHDDIVANADSSPGNI